MGRPGVRGQRIVMRKHTPNARNRTKLKVRVRVEHCFGVIKRVFGFAEVRYCGLDKNANRLFVTCVLGNLLVVRHRLLRL